MKKLLYASKGWKKLQKEYIDENCFAQRSQKLAAVSQQDVTGFPYYAPDGRHEEMRNKECCYTLRQMRIGYVKTKLCPLVIPSECPACRRKFFEMAGFTSEV